MIHSSCVTAEYVDCHKGMSKEDYLQPQLKRSHKIQNTIRVWIIIVCVLGFTYLQNVYGVCVCVCVGVCVCVCASGF